MRPHEPQPCTRSHAPTLVTHWPSPDTPVAPIVLTARRPKQHDERWPMHPVARLSP